MVGGDAPHKREHYCDGMIRHLRRTVVWCIAHWNATARASVKVDVIEAHARLHHDSSAIHVGDQSGRQVMPASAIDHGVGATEGIDRHFAARADNVELDPVAGDLPLDIGLVSELRVD